MKQIKAKVGSFPQDSIWVKNRQKLDIGSRIEFKEPIGMVMRTPLRNIPWKTGYIYEIRNGLYFIERM